MKKINLMISALFLLQGGVFAQSTKRAEIPIGVEFYNHTIGLPFGNPYKKPFNLGLALTTSYPLKLGRNSKLTLDGGLGYFKHKELATGIHINTGISYTYTTNIGIYAALGIPIGYVRTFNAYDLYENNGAGEYVLIKDRGRSGVFAGYNVQVGYDFRRTLKAPIAVFLKNEWWLQANYSKFLPSLMQNSLRVGVNIYPFKNN